MVDIDGRSPEVELTFWNLTNLKHADEGGQCQDDNALKISNIDPQDPAGLIFQTFFSEIQNSANLFTSRLRDSIKFSFTT